MKQNDKQAEAGQVFINDVLLKNVFDFKYLGLTFAADGDFRHAMQGAYLRSLSLTALKATGHKTNTLTSFRSSEQEGSSGQARFSELKSHALPETS